MTQAVQSGRWHGPGLNGFVVAVKNGKPAMVVEYVSDFLFAVDLKGEGVKQTLWTQRFSSENFFTPGQADQVILKNGKLVSDKAVRVPASFRPMGAAFSNVMGKDTRALALVDEGAAGIDQFLAQGIGHDVRPSCC